MTFWPRLTCLLLALLLVAGCSTLEPSGQSAVATAHPLATQAAFRTLDRGGNAFDAAVTAAAVLGVVEPYGSGLGGGGFWLLQKPGGQTTFIDARETAPLAATETMYLDTAGDPIPGASRNGPLAAAIPGEPAALALVAEKYGRLPLSVTLKDAISLADEGFRVYRKYLDMVYFRLDELKKHPASAARFLDNGEAPRRGYLIRQPQLAETLRALARKGHDGFYKGKVARQLVEDVRAAGGIWQPEDLAGYKVREREAHQFRFRDATITSAALPSSGGIVLHQMLGIIEHVSADALTPAQRVLLNVSAMDRAYRDRAAYLGDPDFVDVPVGDLVRQSYLAYLGSNIERNILLGKEISDWEGALDDLETSEDSDETHHTTHISVIDKYGNRASVTLSINLPFGSGFVSERTGVLLNNEMDDFSIRPGTPNAYGLVGNTQNAIAPGKRPLSSMTPTIIETDDKVFVLGTPGGSRIITMVLLSTLNLLDGGSAEAAVAAGRYHYQFRPDSVQFEPDALSSEVQRYLVRMGHTLTPLARPYGNMQLVILDKKTRRLSAASDPRGMGQAIVR